ncbi:hypothetical protein OH77DRAFT_839862 [Trametes cingulata]|nr:hypothetical protein OH77DRAFT_839862 [Trametes cingulata]
MLGLSRSKRPARRIRPGGTYRHRAAGLRTRTVFCLLVLCPLSSGGRAGRAGQGREGFDWKRPGMIANFSPSPWCNWFSSRLQGSSSQLSCAQAADGDGGRTRGRRSNSCGRGPRLPAAVMLQGSMILRAAGVGWNSKSALGSFCGERPCRLTVSERHNGAGAEGARTRLRPPLIPAYILSLQSSSPEIHGQPLRQRRRLRAAGALLHRRKMRRHRAARLFRYFDPFPAIHLHSSSPTPTVTAARPSSFARRAHYIDSTMRPRLSWSSACLTGSRPRKTTMPYRLASLAKCTGRA